MNKRGHFHNSQHKAATTLEDKVVLNLVELQKVQTNLAEKFDKLSNQIASLLGLFESAAKSFANNPAIQASEKDREFLDKINKLLEQNKTIAKGLTLMEERIRERAYGNQSPPLQSPPSQLQTRQIIQIPKAPSVPMPSLIEERGSPIEEKGSLI